MPTDKAAVIVGIDHYGTTPKDHLFGCVKDATDLAEMLSHHENGDLNFDCTVMTSLDTEITQDALEEEVEKLFAADISCAVFYFAGHCSFDQSGSGGRLITQDTSKRQRGLNVSYLMELANKAYPRIRSSVIILDCCYAAGAGVEQAGQNQYPPSSLGTGVTVLAAAQANQTGRETMNGGVFTQLIVDAMRGSAADMEGNISPASVYAHIDQSLPRLAQRPVYKANVSEFISLRKCKERLAKQTLRLLSEWFPTEDHHHKLTPKHEPNRDNVPKDIMDIDPDPELVEVFKQLQACNRQGLVVSVDAEHMYYAAIERKACALTPLGKHYWRLAKNGRI